MKRLVLFAAMVLAGCGGKPCSTPPPVIVKVPVPQPCAGLRPDHVTDLKVRTPNWPQMDVRQKAASVGQWALELQGYGQKLDAATAGCP